MKTSDLWISMKGGTCTMYKTDENAYRILVDKTEMKEVSRTKWKCKDNIKVDLNEIGHRCVDWFNYKQFSW